MSSGRSNDRSNDMSNDRFSGVFSDRLNGRLNDGVMGLSGGPRPTVRPLPPAGRSSRVFVIRTLSSARVEI